MYLRSGSILLALLSLLSTCALAQNAPAVPRDTAVQEYIDIDRADEAYMFQQGKGQRLVGNVELSQDSIFMYCDSARVIDEVQVYAYSDVTIQQGDSLAAFAEELDYNAETLLAKLRRNVVLTRGETELYTSRLDYDLATKLATYHTGGRIVNKDTELRSTHGYYYADQKVIYFRDSVVAIDERFEMRADTLMYDLANERVHFLGPTVIRTDTHTIYCEAGYYDVQLDQAVFARNAQYKSGERLAAADTIRYFGGAREVYFLEGNAYVAEGSWQRATAERIQYFRREERFRLEGNAFLRDSTQNVRGDTIAYDQRTDQLDVAGGRPMINAPPMIIEAERVTTDPVTGARRAEGQVYWQDTSANLAIVTESAIYNDETGYLQATGGAGPDFVAGLLGLPPDPTLGDRPLLISELDGDTLWLVADTLVSVQTEEADSTFRTYETGRDSVLIGDSLAVTILTATDTTVTVDSVRYLSAHRDVRILKADLQAVCDSLGFNTVDSILTLYDDPVLWQDSSQLTGDTINILFERGSLDRVQLNRRALVLTTPDLVFFNQVKGKLIEAFFDSTSLRRTEVTGNAEAVYYIQDDAAAYIGVNKTACSAMTLDFLRGSVRRIKFLDAPGGKMEPMDAVDHEALKLDGFRWEEKRRPLTVPDLFRQRSKPSLPEG